jgi:hypothetical protein
MVLMTKQSQSFKCRFAYNTGLLSSIFGPSSSQCYGCLEFLKINFSETISRINPSSFVVNKI